MYHLAFSANCKGLIPIHFWGDIVMEFWSAYSHPLFFIVDHLLFKSPHAGSFMLNSESRDKEVQHHSISVILKSNINTGASV